MKMRILPLAAFFGATAFVTVAAAAADIDPGFVAHEWGTFTCVQGANGVQMEWDPLAVVDLPEFVYSRVHVASGRKAHVRGFVVAGKTGTVQRQRMETPVIYFYSDRTRTVD